MTHNPYMHDMAEFLPQRTREPGRHTFRSILAKAQYKDSSIHAKNTHNTTNTTNTNTKTNTGKRTIGRTHDIADAVRNTGSIKRRKTAPSRRGMDQQTRAMLWGWYIGASVKKALCPVCGMNDIKRDVDAAWEGAHIVARVLDKQNSMLRGRALASITVPACRSCNNNMRSCNLIDYMFISGYTRQMRRLLWKWFSQYPFPDAKRACDGVMWQLVNAKFGPRAFPDGGGIEHTIDIYNLLRQYQQKKIAKRVKKLNKKATRLLALSDLVAQRINM